MATASAWLTIERKPIRVMIEVHEPVKIGSVTPGKQLYGGPLDDCVPEDSPEPKEPILSGD